MKLTRCPVCHSNIHLDALIQDQAGRDLLGDVAALPDFIARPLLNYIGLFRPLKSDLSNGRALRLMREVTDEYKADHLLASALIETVNKLREKRIQFQDVKPLANHNYLKQVYKSLAVKNNVAMPTENHAHQGKAEAVQTTKPDDSQWYIEQANRMVKMGIDPLGENSTIANKLKEMNWKRESENG
ncbi:MAG: hypothetical protein ACK5MF_09355 [Vibrio sp.]|uniref:hypothetical protein n=1 Tax=Vibrio sp. TaxID=678 RepID=UPI003A84CA91